MVEIPEIVDRDSLEIWFNALPKRTDEQKIKSRQIALWIANRCAMRVLPVAIRNASLNKKNVTAITVLRALLISGVVARSSKPLKAFREAAADAAASASSAQNDTIRRTSTAAQIAERAEITAFATRSSPRSFKRATTRAAAASDVAKRASVRAVSGNTDLIGRAASCSAGAAATGDKGMIAESIASATMVMSEIWLEIQADCSTAERINLEKPLWRDQERSLIIERQQAKIWFETHHHSRSVESAQGKGVDIDWSFWMDWYDGALNGEPLDWDMQGEVALIDPDIWDGDPAALMIEINAIRLKYAAADVRNGEVLRYNSKSSQIEADVITEVSEDLSAEAKERLLDLAEELEEALAGPKGNQLTAFGKHPQKIRRYLDRYGHRPIRLYELASDLNREVDAAKENGLCDDGDEFINEIYQVGLGRGAIDLFNAEPTVRERVLQRNQIKLEALQEEDIAELEAVQDFIEPILEEGLNAEMVDDLNIVFDPQQSMASKLSAAYWWLGRAVQVVAIYSAIGVIKTDAKIVEGAKGAVKGAGRVVKSTHKKIYTPSAVIATYGGATAVIIALLKAVGWM